MPDTDAGGDAAEAGISTTATDTKTLTQSQIDSIVGRAEKKSARDATKALLTELGVSDVSEIQTLLDSARQAEEARLSEQEKATRRAAEAEAVAAQKIEQANAQLAMARITAALAPHMDLKAIKRIAPTIRIDPDASDEEIEGIIDDLREEVPGLFSSSPSQQTQQPPGTTSQYRSRPTSKRTAASDQEDVAAWVDKWMGENEPGSLPLL